MPKVRVSDIDMHYDEVGSGPPLLISTGWARAERAFIQHRELLAQNFRCIRHDHRGIGASDAPDAPYSIEMMADDLAVFIHKNPSLHLILESWNPSFQETTIIIVGNKTDFIRIFFTGNG